MVAFEEMGTEKLNARKLNASEIDELVNTLLREVLPLSGIEEVRLFGSAARNEMTEASDLDLIFIFSDVESAKSASKQVHQKRKESAAWPTDIICIDRVAYDERSKVGGVFMIAKEEGKTVFKSEET